MKTSNYFTIAIIATTIICATQTIAQTEPITLETISETREYRKAKAQGEKLFQSLRANVPASTQNKTAEKTLLEKSEIPEYLTSSLSDKEWNKIQLTDDGSALLQIPFTFSFFDSDQNTVWVNANGTLSFESSLGNFQPEYFPLNVKMIAPFWADLQESSKYDNSGVYFLQEENNLRILYQNMALYNGDDANTITFEVILKSKSESDSGNVDFAYHHISPKLIESLMRNQQKGEPLFISGINAGDQDNHLLIRLFDKLIYSFSLAEHHVYTMMNSDYYSFNMELKNEIAQNVSVH